MVTEAPVDLTPFIGGTFAIRRLGMNGCELATGSIVDTEQTGCLIGDVLEEDREAEPGNAYSVTLCGPNGVPTRTVTRAARVGHVDNGRGYLERVNNGDSKDIIIQQMRHIDKLVETMVRMTSSIGQVMSGHLERQARTIQTMEAERTVLLRRLEESKPEEEDSDVKRLVSLVGPMAAHALGIPALAPGPEDKGGKPS